MVVLVDSVLPRMLLRLQVASGRKLTGQVAQKFRAPVAVKVGTEPCGQVLWSRVAFTGCPFLLGTNSLLAPRLAAPAPACCGALKVMPGQWKVGVQAPDER